MVSFDPSYRVRRSMSPKDCQVVDVLATPDEELGGLKKWLL